MLARAGQQLDNLTFFRADGTTVTLNELVTQPTLLIFLRHLV